MKKLFSEKEFENSKADDFLKCQCYNCDSVFFVKKRRINDYLLRKKGIVKFCGLKCAGESKTKKYTQNVQCLNCKKEFLKKNSQAKRSPNHFCSRSCSTIYANAHKTKGSNRSKLEIWIEDQLLNKYPNLQFQFNKKEAIGMELDIYSPELNVAFELNGIFHYEAIFDTKKLENTKKTDLSKTKACYDAKIDLCVIDTSSQKYFKESTSKKFLDIITNIIDSRISIL